MLLLSLVAQAQVDLENITDPRQRINYIKRNSKNYFFREARYGEAIAPRDTAIYLVYLDFMLGANERRQQEKEKLPPLSKAQVENTVTELDVNYGSYNRIMIYCEKHKVLPVPKSEQPQAENGPKPTPNIAGGGNTPPPPFPIDVHSAIEVPLSQKIIKDLLAMDSYPDFIDVLQEERSNGTITNMGVIRADNSEEIYDNYIAVFNKDSNELLAIMEPQTNKTFRNVATGKPVTFSELRAISPNIKRIYFR